MTDSKPAGGTTKRYGVIDMVTPPHLDPFPGTKRGYCDTGVGFKVAGGNIPAWWANAQRSEVDWVMVQKAAKSYPRDAIVGIDIEDPWQPDIRKTNFKYAMESRHLISRVAAEMNNTRPDLTIGVYAAIPNMFWESGNPELLAKWRTAAAFCQPIIDASDIVMPVSYLHYDADDVNDEQDIKSDSINIDNEVGEAIKLAKGKPVVPWVSAQIYDRDMTKSRDVSPRRFMAALERLLKLGCSGVAFWEYNNGAMPTGHQIELLEIAVKVFGRVKT